ncbi:hypothetical protein KY316_02020 [Candidatus Woesearchaeota archaeon]|nr:hypothetical protein [Candidatus Woesearchaeota archaeon]
MALGMSMSMEMNDIPSLRAERPEIDREKLASLVDIISKASAKEPEQHDEDMLRQIYDSRLTYRKKDRLYYIGNNDLTDDYLIRLQYIGAKLGSRKVDIRTKTALKRKEIEDIVEDFASQNGVVLERAEKSIRPGAGRFNYISVKHNNNELVRIFGSKISFVHDRLKLNEDDYRLGLDLTARLIADYHEEDKIAQNIRKFDYCSYAVPLYLRIPGWYKKNYLGDLIRGFQAFIENPKDKELKIANPVQDGLINADELARKTKKYKGCYVVEDKYKKRHVSYVFGDRDKQATVKLDCNIDVFHIRNLIKKPSEVSLYGGPRIPFSEAEPALVRKAHEEKQLMSRTARGNHLLRNTKYAGLCLSLGKNTKIYHDDKELVTLGNQTIKVNARNEY